MSGAKALAVDMPEAVETELAAVGSKALLIVYATMISAWMLDFRSEGAGQGLAVQAVFLIVYCLATVIFYVAFRGRQPAKLNSFLCACALFLVVSVSASLLRGQETYGVFRQVCTLLIYVSIAHATALMILKFADTLVQLRSLLSALVLSFLIANVAIVMAGGGLVLSAARYEIIGSSIVVALGYLVLSLKWSLTKLEWIAAGLGLLILALAATRTWLVVVAMLVAVMLACTGLTARIGRRMVTALVFICLAAGCLELSGMAVVERWNQRLFVSTTLGVDPTGLSRQRQLDSMTASIGENLWWGAGLQGPSFYWLEPSLGGDEGMATELGFGHNQHVSMIFVAGLIGGGPLLVIQMLQGLIGAGFMWRARRVREGNRTYLGSLGAMIVIGTLCYGTLGGTFASRGMSLWYGVGTGLLIGCSTLCRHGARSA